MSDSIETNEAMARPWTRPPVSEGTLSAQRVLGEPAQIAGYLWPSGRMDRDLPAGSDPADVAIASQCKALVLATPAVLVAGDLFCALVDLHDNMLRQDAEVEAERPTEDEYQACMRNAEAVIAKATGSAS